MHTNSCIIDTIRQNTCTYASISSFQALKQAQERSTIKLGNPSLICLDCFGIRRPHTTQVFTDPNTVQYLQIRMSPRTVIEIPQWTRVCHSVYGLCRKANVLLVDEKFVNPKYEGGFKRHMPSALLSDEKSLNITWFGSIINLEMY